MCVCVNVQVHVCLYGVYIKYVSNSETQFSLCIWRNIRDLLSKNRPYFVKNEIISLAESAFATDHSDT